MNHSIDACYDLWLTNGYNSHPIVVPSGDAVLPKSGCNGGSIHSKTPGVIDLPIRELAIEKYVCV